LKPARFEHSLEDQLDAGWPRAPPRGPRSWPIHGIRSTTDGGFLIDSRTRNALLVYPRFPPSYWGFQYALELLDKGSAMPPLGLITVAGMFPDGYRLRLVDMNVAELTDDDLDWADLVLTSTMVVQRRSLQEVIARCNRRGTPVVVGGPHPTSYFDEIHGADHYVLEEVEESFPRFLADWEAGCAETIYRPEGKPAVTDTPVPRFDLLDLDAYSSMALQFSRGCPFDCEFCDITKLFGRKPRTKSNEQMTAEMDALYDLGWRGAVFLVDDNFIGNKKEALRLLPAVTEWQRERDYPFGLYTEASVNLAKLDPLMDAMVDAGFSMVFLGIESPNPEALQKTKKGQNTARGDDDFLLHAVRTIQNRGLEVSGGFILGLDGDGSEVFDAQVDFIQEAGIPMAMVGLLTAIRGTDLYHRLEREGRLLEESTGNNVEVTLNFEPELDRDVLIEGYRQVLARLYDPSLESYFERCWTLLANLGPGARPCREISKSEVRGALRSFRRQLLSRQAPGYLKLLGRTLLRRPAMFPEAVRLGIMGLHFQKFTEQTLAAHEFRETALEDYDRVEGLVLRAGELRGRAGKALRRHAHQTLRRLRRLNRRLRPEFRPSLPDWPRVREGIQSCVRDSAALQLLHRAGPTFRGLFEGISWPAALKTRGYALAERRGAGTGVENGGRRPTVSVAPLLEEGRMRRSLEVFLEELGVQVMTATEQIKHLGNEGLERLARIREEGHDATDRLLEYLGSVGGSIDTLVVPLTEGVGHAGESAQVLVARASSAAANLPQLVCLRIESGRRKVRESLADLGLALTGDRRRVDAALERAMVWV
jgi:radical SAM superfamily enzyme YgiQ (UPF0313 family)